MGETIHSARMGPGSREMLAFGEEWNRCWKLRGSLKWQSDVLFCQSIPRENCSYVYSYQANFNFYFIFIVQNK